MNHLNPDESPDRDDDIDSFEQQLRAIRPAPPTRDFSEIAEVLEVDSKDANVVASVPATSSIWRPIISHAVTAAIGLAIGVGVMLLLQPTGVPVSAGSPENVADLSASVELVINPSPDEESQNAKPPEALATVDQVHASYPQPGPVWRTYRGPLRAFGSIDARLASVRDWQPHHQHQHHDFKQPSDGSDSDIEYDDLPADKPPLSPRSLHLFLDDLTYSPTSDNPFCSATDFSS